MLYHALPLYERIEAVSFKDIKPDTIKLSNASNSSQPLSFFDLPSYPLMGIFTESAFTLIGVFLHFVSSFILSIKQTAVIKNTNALRRYVRYNRNL